MYFVGLDVAAATGISVAVTLGLIILIVIFIVITLIVKFHHHKNLESGKAAVCNEYKIPEKGTRKYNNIDISRNSTISHISSVDDNNCDNFVDTLANEKNSYSTIV